MEANTAKHPQSLCIFFGTEMWERYGFYVVQTLLALYLALFLQWSDDKTYELVGSFTALTYISPIIGGWIADKLLGQKVAIIIGILFLFLSYCLLAAVAHHYALASALAGIAVGTGLLKPNISSLLGNEYPVGSPLRESGFTIFYMGITTGIILGTTLPSQLYFYFGWPIAFASSLIGMLLALAVFIFGIMVYKIENYNPPAHSTKTSLKAFSLIALLWAISFYVLYYPVLANFLFIGIIALAALYLITTIINEPEQQARLTLVIGLLCLISIIFWTFYFQMFLSLTLYIKRVVQPSIFGIQFPPPYYVTIQSIGMLFFGYFLSKKTLKMNKITTGINAAKKFLIAISCVVIAYLSIVCVNYFMDSQHVLSPLYIVPAYLLFSLAELLLSPVGLSAITVMADRDKVSTIMGIFFVSLGTGGYLSGKLASIASIETNLSHIAVLRAHYTTAFSEIFIILLIAALFCLGIFFLIQRILRKNIANAE